MDRLVIESTLSDVNEVFLSKDNEDETPYPAIVLGFKAANIDQIINAFSSLKELVKDEEVKFVICKTLQSGIYDLEIKTPALDEPIRIMNKVISNEELGEIEDQISSNAELILAINVSEQRNWIRISNAEIKDCNIQINK